MNIKSSLFKNDELVQCINTVGDYDKENNIISFNDKDTSFKIHFNKKYVDLERENRDYIFKLVLSSKENVCYLKLKEQQYPFPIKVTRGKIILKDNILTIYYSIETEEKALNKLVIEWSAENEESVKKDNQ